MGLGMVRVEPDRLAKLGGGFLDLAQLPQGVTDPDLGREPLRIDPDHRAILGQGLGFLALKIQDKGERPVLHGFVRVQGDLSPGPSRRLGRADCWLRSGPPAPRVVFPRD